MASPEDPNQRVEDALPSSDHSTPTRSRNQSVHHQNNTSFFDKQSLPVVVENSGTLSNDRNPLFSNRSGDSSPAPGEMWVPSSSSHQEGRRNPTPSGRSTSSPVHSVTLTDKSDDFSALVVDFGAESERVGGVARHSKKKKSGSESLQLDFTMPWHSMWYSSPQTEQQFLIFMASSSKYRFLALCILGSIVGTYLLLTDDNKQQQMYVLACMVIFAITLIAEVALFIVMKVFGSSTEASTRETYWSDDELQTKRQQDDSMNASSSSFSEATLSVTSFDVRIARAHELVGALMWLVTLPLLSSAYAFVQSKCYYLYSTDGRAPDERCPFKLYCMYYCFMLAPLFVGGCRNFFIYTAYGISFGLAIAVVTFHDASFAGKLLLFIIVGVFISFVSILQFLTEKRRRQVFKVSKELAVKTVDIKQHNKALQAFVSSIIPSSLQHRLLSSSAASRVQVDSSDHALCVIVDIFNVVAAMNALLPTVAATEIGMLNVRLLNAAEEFHVNHIRTVGDTNYFVKNLFRRENSGNSVPSSAMKGRRNSSGSQSRSRSIDNTQENSAFFNSCLSCLRFSLGALKTGEDFNLRCSIGSGRLIGMPMGTACITYDVFGPALSVAQTMLLSCPSNRCLTTDQIVAQASSLFSFDKIPKISASWFLVVGEKSAASGPPSGSGFLPGDPMVEDLYTPPILGDGTKEDVGLDLAQHLTAKEIVLRENLNTNLTTGCCFIPRFEEEEVETMWHAYQRKRFRKSFLISCCFFVIYLVLLLAAVGEDQSGKLHGELIAFFVMTSLAAFGFALIGIVGYTDTDESDGEEPFIRTPTASRITCALCLVAIVGLNLSRPSVVGDDPSSFMFICLVVCPHFGGPIIEVLAAQVVFVVVNYMMLLHHPVVAEVTIAAVPLSLVAIIHSVISEREQRRLFIDVVKRGEALVEAQGYCELREAVENGLIPSQVRPRVTPATLTRGTVDVWGCDYAAILHIIIPPIDSTSPRDIRCHAESTMGRIEASVVTCTYKTLDIIKVFGSTIIVAGPLEDAKSIATSANPKQTVGSTVQAVADAMEVVDRLMSSGLQFTAGVANEQIINVLRLNDFPSYEIMGFGVNAARALAFAAPRPMVVATQKLVQLYQRECSPRDSLLIGEPESWRLRGVGSMQVYRLRAATFAKGTLGYAQTVSRSNHDTRSIGGSEVSVDGISFTSGRSFRRDLH